MIDSLVELCIKFIHRANVSYDDELIPENILNELDYSMFWSTFDWKACDKEFCDEHGYNYESMCEWVTRKENYTYSTDGMVICDTFVRISDRQTFLDAKFTKPLCWYQVLFNTGPNAPNGPSGVEWINDKHIRFQVPEEEEYIDVWGRYGLGE